MSTCGGKLREVLTVEPVIFFYMTSTFIVSPASQKMIVDKVCYQRLSAPLCLHPAQQSPSQAEEVAAQVSMILLIFTALLSLTSILPAMLLGSWSDLGGSRGGRRRAVMVLPCLMSLASGGVLIAMSLVPGINVYWVLAAGGLTGVTGGYVSVFLSCFSYLADVTEAGADRTLRMGVAESMVFLGGTVGFLVSGVLIQEVGLYAAFCAHCVCQLAAVLYVLLWLRDPASSPSPEIRALPQACDDSVEVTSSPKWWAVQSYARNAVTTVFRRREGSERTKLLLLFICTFLNNLLAIGEGVIILLYLTSEPRNFSIEMYGVYNSARMLMLGVFLLVVFPLLLRARLGEMTLAKLSALFRTAAFILLAFSTNTWMVFLGIAVYAPTGVTQAVVRAASSKIVEPHEQGAMFSFSASLEASSIVLAAAVFNGLYPVTLHSFPGMPFIVMATFSIIIFIMIQWVSEMPTTQPRLLLQD